MKKKKCRRTRALSLLCAPALMMASSAASGADIHGVFSLEDYYSKDSSSSVTYNLLTTRLRLDATKLNEAGNLAFHFDGRDRVNLGTKLTGNHTGNQKITQLNVDYQGSRFYLAVGRLWPKEMPAEVVDGLNIVYQRSERSGFGVFGGARPNPNNESFTKDYTTAGIYAYYHREEFSGTLSYVNNGFKGGIDRQYIYGQSTFMPIRQMTILTMATADLKPSGMTPSLTNGIAEIAYRPDYQKGIAVGYNFFRAIKLYKSQPVPLDDSRQTSVYVSGNYRIKEKYNLYARAERQSRFFPTIQREFRNLHIYRAGMNIDNAFYGFNMDFSASTTGGDGSKHNSFNFEMNRLIQEKFQLVLNTSYMQNSFSTTNSDNVWTYGVSGYVYLTRAWNFSFTFDREQARSYDANHIFTRASYKF